MLISELSVNHERISKGLQIQHFISLFKRKKEIVENDGFTVMISDKSSPAGGATFELPKRKRNNLKGFIIEELDNKIEQLEKEFDEL